MVTFLSWGIPYVQKSVKDVSKSSVTKLWYADYVDVAGEALERIHLKSYVMGGV